MLAVISTFTLEKNTTVALWTIAHANKGRLEIAKTRPSEHATQSFWW